ncbi:hypothetical protein [Segatella albensis]|uniref:hypothetical protein n=1 Tax=Segatella albensis TaxID=77768 RepID=UPI000426BA57|nr:hypothetical protein [Segatella albensis]
MISKDSIESAYCFFHQKWNIYAKSSINWQKDDIEYAIDQYTIEMNQELYRLLAHGNEHFLRNHQTFAQDIASAVDELEKML